MPPCWSVASLIDKTLLDMSALDLVEEFRSLDEIKGGANVDNFSAGGHNSIGEMYRQSKRMSNTARYWGPHTTLSLSLPVSLRGLWEK